MTVHTILATESHMVKMKEDSEKHIQIPRPAGLHMRIGDAVQFKYNGEAGDAEWLTPPRQIGYIHAKWIELAPEETFVQAQRRWRREEKENEIARKQKHGASSAPQALQPPPHQEIHIPTTS
jgi:hypothetical protein